MPEARLWGLCLASRRHGGYRAGHGLPKGSYGRGNRSWASIRSVGHFIWPGVIWPLRLHFPSVLTAKSQVPRRLLGAVRVFRVDLWGGSNAFGGPNRRDFPISAVFRGSRARRLGTGSGRFDRGADGKMPQMGKKKSFAKVLKF